LRYREQSQRGSACGIEGDAAMVVKCVIAILAIAAGTSHAFASEVRLTAEQAKDAAMASLRLIRGSSIDPNFDIRDARNVDLDGDGVNEVVYRYSAICPDTRHDCPNEIMVMTSKVPRELPSPMPYVGMPSALETHGPAVVVHGYANDAGAHIPGEIKALAIQGNELSVTFVNTGDSPPCRHSIPTRYYAKPFKRCPAPGRYTWHYGWTPGFLTRTEIPSAAQKRPITRQAAQRATEASLRANDPGDGEVEYDYRARHVQAIDLDGDGAQEIVYLLTSTNTGFGPGDATNALIVMTWLKPDDLRGVAPYPESHGYDVETYDKIRASGYADDVGVHIPGEVERIRIDGTTIIVTFLSKTGSPICLPRDEKSRGYPCPPPGKHTWRYRWTPEHIVRVEHP
jgi:hypothetical protein